MQQRHGRWSHFKHVCVCVCVSVRGPAANTEGYTGKNKERFFAVLNSVNTRVCRHLCVDESAPPLPLPSPIRVLTPFLSHRVGPWDGRRKGGGTFSRDTGTGGRGRDRRAQYVTRAASQIEWHLTGTLTRIPDIALPPDSEHRLVSTTPSQLLPRCHAYERRAQRYTANRKQRKTEEIIYIYIHTRDVLRCRGREGRRRRPQWREEEADNGLAHQEAQTRHSKRTKSAKQPSRHAHGRIHRQSSSLVP